MENLWMPHGSAGSQTILFRSPILSCRQNQRGVLDRLLSFSKALPSVAIVFVHRSAFGTQELHECRQNKMLLPILKLCLLGYYLFCPAASALTLEDLFHVSVDESYAGNCADQGLSNMEQYVSEGISLAQAGLDFVAAATDSDNALHVQAVRLGDAWFREPDLDDYESIESELGSQSSWTCLSKDPTLLTTRIYSILSKCPRFPRQRRRRQWSPTLSFLYR